MSLYTSAVKYEPDLEVPEDEEIDKTSVDGKFLKRLERFHLGLGSVSVTAYYRKGPAEMRCPTQRYIIKGGGKQKKPAISADNLARLIVCCSQFHCDELSEKVPGLGEVQYRVIFYGETESGTFQNTASFRLRPEEPDDNETKKQEPEEDQTPQADIAPDPTIALPARRVFDIGTPVPRSVLETEVVETLKVTAAMTQAAFQQCLAAVEQIRTDLSAGLVVQNQAWQTIVASSNSVTEYMKKENDDLRSEVTKANNRLITMTEKHASQHDGEKKILQYAMDMFVEGMKAQWGALNRDMSWERQIMYQQFDNLADKYKRENKYEMLKDFAPIGLAVVGSILDGMGNKAGAAMLAAVAGGPQPEPEPDPPPPTPTRRAPPQRPTVTNVPQAQYAAQRFEQHPVASMLQLFGAKIADKQEEVKSVIGEKPFELLVQAVSAHDDAEARTRGSKFIASLMPNLRSKLEGILDPETRELFGDIHTKVFGTRGRETISEPSIAELRTIAKEKHGLTFPKDATKEQILEAIQKAS